MPRTPCPGLASYNYFVTQGVKNILKANNQVTSSHDSRWFLRYTDLEIGMASHFDNFEYHSVSPQECRLRDLTYSAPIWVNVEYQKGGKVTRKLKVLIGSMPVMLKSCKCILSGKDPHQLAELGECALDPGGYFVVKGQEKVILLQEQMSYNRILVSFDQSGNPLASVTSYHIFLFLF